MGTGQWWGPFFKLGAGGEIYADETRIISANQLSAHRPISSNINRISASHSGLKCVFKCQEKCFENG